MGEKILQLTIVGIFVLGLIVFILNPQSLEIIAIGTLACSILAGLIIKPFINDKKD